MSTQNTCIQILCRTAHVNTPFIHTQVPVVARRTRMKHLWQLGETMTGIGVTLLLLFSTRTACEFNSRRTTRIPVPVTSPSLLVTCITIVAKAYYEQYLHTLQRCFSVLTTCTACAHLPRMSTGPMAESYSPPGTAFLRLSKMTGCTMRFTLMRRTCTRQTSSPIRRCDCCKL